MPVNDYKIEKPILFPKPKEIITDGDILDIGETGRNTFVIRLSDTTAQREKEGANFIADRMECLTAVRPAIDNDHSTLSEKTTGRYIIRFTRTDTVIGNGSDEGYHLKIDKDSALLTAASDKGLYYAAHTFASLISVSGGRISVPCLSITDWPDMKYRGLYVETRYGTDLMELNDWKVFIDRIASLKLNSLTIGVYGCWCVQYCGEVSEYLYLPLDSLPGIKTESTIRYRSIQENIWKTHTYVPAIFRDDFLGKLIEYGKTKNILVKPHFNTLGHNTLIPRLLPDISARDSNGIPTGYGFCTSNPHTYETLFKCFDEIIDRYLKPNGIDWIHIGLDEVIEMTGTNPTNPLKKVDPWCKCRDCSQQTHEELFLNHLVKLAKYLKNKGINNISVWHDQLLKLGLIESTLADKFKQEDLIDTIVLHWWRYRNEVFETIRPELGLRRFIIPMAGYYHWSLNCSYLVNIARMLELGHRELAEGTEGYCVVDTSFDRNFTCLAEYSWNKRGTANLEEFRRDYALMCAPDDPVTAVEAFEYFDRLVEPGESFQLLFGTICYYPCTYPREGLSYPRNFPGEAIVKLRDNLEKNLGLLQKVLRDSVNAVAAFDSLLKKPCSNRAVLLHYKVESRMFMQLAKEGIKLLEFSKALDALTDDKLSRLKLFNLMIEETGELICGREALMLEMESTKASYLLPSELRNASIHLQFLFDLVNALKKAVEPDLSDGTKEEVTFDLCDTRWIESTMFKLLR